MNKEQQIDYLANLVIDAENWRALQSFADGRTVNFQEFQGVAALLKQLEQLKKAKQKTDDANVGVLGR